MLSAASPPFPILSPPMRAILWRSIGLALVLVAALAVGLQRLLSWFATRARSGSKPRSARLSHPAQYPGVDRLDRRRAWRGVRRSIFDAAITSLVASVFVDDVADHVERAHYPAERPGTALPVGLP